MINKINLFSIDPAPWMSASFPIIRFVILLLLVVLSIALTIIVLIQPSNSQGIGALSGQSDTFYSKNKGRTLEGTFKRLTVIIGIVMFVLAVLFFVTLIFYAGN